MKRYWAVYLLMTAMLAAATAATLANVDAMCQEHEEACK